MQTYRFTLELTKLDLDAFAELLYARCHDALVTSRHEVPCINFDREAVSFEAAWRSAVQDVAASGGCVVRVTKDEEKEP